MKQSSTRSSSSRIIGEKNSVENVLSTVVKLTLNHLFLLLHKYVSVNISVLVILHQTCNNQGDEYIFPVVEKLLEMKSSIGMIGIWEDEVILGYYSQRKGMQLGFQSFVNPFPSIFIQKVGIDAWIQYTTEQSLGYLLVHIEPEVNQWRLYVTDNYSMEVIVDIYGVACILVVILGAQALVRYYFFAAVEAQKGNNSKVGNRINLMVNVVLVEMLANTLRVISAFGTGLNLIGTRYLTFYALFIIILRRCLTSCSLLMRKLHTHDMLTVISPLFI
jgi:hypothetical protein